MQQRDANWGDTASSLVDDLRRLLNQGALLFFFLLSVIANLATLFGPLLTPIWMQNHVPVLSHISDFLQSHLDAWAALMGAFTTALLLYAGWLSSRMRHRILVLSQRRLPSLSVVAVIVAPALVLLGLALVVYPLLLSFLTGARQAAGSSTIRQDIAVATILAASAVAAVLGWVNQRMHVGANRCRAIVEQIADQQAAKDQPLVPFEFEREPRAEVIRQYARVLDELDERGIAGVRRSSFGWSYVLARPEDEKWVRLEQVLRRSNSTPTEHADVLTDIANEVWICGIATGRWRPIGGPAASVRYVQLFGNRLDTLFNAGAGLRMYDAGGPRFVVMVIKGQPGAGKSTLGLQMCVTLAKQGQLCIYYSLEEERNVLLQAAKNFGWDQPGPQYRGVHSYTISKSIAQVRARQHLIKQRSRRQGHVSQHDDRPLDGIVLVSSLGERAMRLSQRRRKLSREWGRSLKTAADLPEAVRCVVIDSLEGFANVGVEGEEEAGVPRDQLLHLKDFFRDRCEMLVLLLEDSGAGTSAYPEFVADVVIHLGHRVDDNYLFLFAEVLKARNQTHALGQAQIKIRAKEDLVTARGAIAEAENTLSPGIQVFPSLHYRLFQSKQESAFDEYTMSTGITGLDEMFSDDAGEPGLRRKAALALIGPRDSGKSLVGMNFLLEGVRENTKTLLLSLRDDADTVRKRRIPQEPGQIFVSWQDMPPPPNQPAQVAAKPERYHQLEWDLDGVLKWAHDRKHAQPQTLQVAWRLPYLFALPPVTYTALMHSPVRLAEAAAVSQYLDQLATALRAIQHDFPLRAEQGGRAEEISWKIDWTTTARERAREACQRAWCAFECDLAIRVVVTQSLVAQVKQDMTGTSGQDAADTDENRAHRARVEVAQRFFPDATGERREVAPADMMLWHAAEEQAYAELLSDADRQRHVLAPDVPLPRDELELTPAMMKVLCDQLQLVDPSVPDGWKRIELIEHDVATARQAVQAVDDSAARVVSLRSAEGTGTAPPPRLQWNSCRWNVDYGRLVPGDDLLVVKPWRPGNITADDFVDQVLRVIGEPPARTGRPGQPDDKDAESEFERVVFDDVAQLPQRFPILDKTRLFLPTLIDMFKARGITSLFLADTARTLTGVGSVAVGAMAGEGSDPYGLEVMADYVIRSGITLPDAEHAPQVVLEVRAVPGSSQQAPHHLEFVSRPGGGPDMVQVVQSAASAETRRE